MLAQAVRLFLLEAIVLSILLERQKELEFLEKTYPNLEAPKLDAYSLSARSK
jgi:hypothetical protein